MDLVSPDRKPLLAKSAALADRSYASYSLAPPHHPEHLEFPFLSPELRFVQQYEVCSQKRELASSPYPYQ